MKGKTISIIVPVYNVEPYLQQCISSILNQTYQNLEIILVDDGSTDRCPEICDGYAVLDKRIKVIHKKNGGLSDARNAGLAVASGEYIGFVDSDDWISSTMYEELIHAAEGFEAEIACCDFVRIENQTILETRKFGIKRRITGRDMIREIFCKNSDNVVVWNKLYVSDLFKFVRFPYGEIHEDNAILCKTIGKAGIVAYTGTVGYYYRFRSNSIMNAMSVEAHFFPLIKHLQETEDFVRRFFFDLCDDYYCYDVRTTMYLLSMFLDCGINETNEEFKTLKKRLSKNLYYFLNNGNISIINKIEAILMIVGVYKPAQNLWRKVIKNKSKRESL